SPPDLLLFFPAAAPTEVYTLSLHDALPICLLTAVPVAPHQGSRASDDVEERLGSGDVGVERHHVEGPAEAGDLIELRQIARERQDRKSTRLNSSHDQISYAVFCLKKKKQHL